MHFPAPAEQALNKVLLGQRTRLQQVNSDVSLRGHKQTFQLVRQVLLMILDSWAPYRRVVLRRSVRPVLHVEHPIQLLAQHAQDGFAN